jgi:uncharacterized damage-inducible protein DinB
MEDPLVETWSIHDRINAYLLDALSDEALTAALPPKGKTVFKQFAHVHNVRLLWLKAAAPDLMTGLDKIESDTGDKTDLIAALAASGKAIAELVDRSIAAGGKVKHFKPHVTAFVGYLISHESHHRGQIGWTLKLTGHPLDKKTAFGIWEWGVR